MSVETLPLPAATAVEPGTLILAIDTATAHAALALGDGHGSPRAVRAWRAGYRHGEELLANLDEVLRTAGARLQDMRGIVAGTGPGTFTGLRVGLAAVKGLAEVLELLIATATVLELLALAANLGSVLILTRYKDGDANVRSVWLCSRNDAIGNVAVMLAALAVWATGTRWPDLIVAALMAGLFFYSSLRILQQSCAEMRHKRALGHSH